MVPLVSQKLFRISLTSVFRRETPHPKFQNINKTKKIKNKNASIIKKSRAAAFIQLSGAGCPHSTRTSVLREDERERATDTRAVEFVCDQGVGELGGRLMWTKTQEPLGQHRTSPGVRRARVGDDGTWVGESEAAARSGLSCRRFVRASHRSNYSSSS